VKFSSKHDRSSSPTTSFWLVHARARALPLVLKYTQTPVPAAHGLIFDTALRHALNVGMLDKYSQSPVSKDACSSWNMRATTKYR